MKKDLPKVYGLNVEHDTNSKVAYTKSNMDIRKDTSEEKNEITKSVHQKIKEIFNSVNYIYKIDAVIKTKNETITKRLVGRNSEYLITIDNEQIPISEILDIYPK